MKKLIETAVTAAIEASSAILEVYARDFAVELKGDKSPVTEADKAADAIIGRILGDGSTLPILTEEKSAAGYEERREWKKFWLVDPLDGTKEFIKKNGEFTVNIALIKGGVPIGGVVYLPVKETLYFALQGEGAFKITDFSKTDCSFDELVKKSEVLVEKAIGKPLIVVASRSHMSKETEDFIEELKKKYGEVEMTSSGSSIKLCLVAEGSADVYPRLAPTMEWDTAAAHAVALAAGCEVVEYESGEPLRYNKEDLLNPWFVVRKKGVRKKGL